jgi:ABC-2 type transport system permease protein
MSDLTVDGLLLGSQRGIGAIRPYFEEIRTECLRYSRTPGYAVPTIIFAPAMLLLSLSASQQAVPDGDIREVLARIGTFGAMAPGLFSFGVAIAVEKDNGFLRLRQVVPAPAASYPLAKMLMALITAWLMTILLLLITAFMTTVHLSPGEVLTFSLVEVMGALPFCALGLLAGSLIKGQSAAGIINLIYLPMAFLAGLWMPLASMPHILQVTAIVWPSYHLNQMSLAALGLQPGFPLVSAVALVAYTAAFFAIALRTLNRSRNE